MKTPTPGRCRCCGCTNDNCRGCIERTGAPCHWVNGDNTLCSACVCDNCGFEAAGRIEYIRLRVAAGIYSPEVVAWCSKCRQHNSGRYRRVEHGGLVKGGAA